MSTIIYFRHLRGAASAFPSANLTILERKEYDQEFYVWIFSSTRRVSLFNTTLTLKATIVEVGENEREVVFEHDDSKGEAPFT